MSCFGFIWRIEDIKANGRIITVAVSNRDTLEQEMGNDKNTKSAEVEGRIVFTPELEFPKQK